MKINEAGKITQITKRAIKFYEQKGFIKVKKDENGYRNFTQEDIEKLNQISLFRKLDISLKDIKILMNHPTDMTQKLNLIYKEKKGALEHNQNLLDNLKKMVDSQCNEKIVKEIQVNIAYDSIGQALMDMVPGNIGQYFMYHFLPYLQEPIQSAEQQMAYDNILEFWDDFDLKLPLFMRFANFIQSHLGKQDMKNMTLKLDDMLKNLLNPTEEEYKKTKSMIQKNVKIKNSFLYKYNPFIISNRKFMIRLQNSGYNDIFIPNMKVLSPKYKAYHEALTNMNERVCNDLGLYYDTNFNLIMKKH